MAQNRTVWKAGLPRCMSGVDWYRVHWHQYRLLSLMYGIDDSLCYTPEESALVCKQWFQNSYPERPYVRTLKWINGNSIMHSHSLDWLLFKVLQCTSITFEICHSLNFCSSFFDLLYYIPTLYFNLFLF